MKKQAVMVLGMVLLAGLVPALAQSSVTARFDIPFEFVVGDVTLPAGDYTVSYEAKTSLLQVGRTGSRISAIVLTRPTQTMVPTVDSELLFNRYGAKHFLSQMWVTGDDRGREILKTNYEREFMAQGLKNTSIQIAAK